MTKRLVWNFELDVNAPPVLDDHLTERTEDLRWEARYFWPDDTPIILYGLNPSLLNLGQWRIKERADTYFLLPGEFLNLKRRREEVLYKPLLQATPYCEGFGKKINLLEPHSQALLPGTTQWTAEALLAQIHSTGTTLFIEKTALIYKLPTTPVIKLELSRLKLNKTIYFSACVEGRSELLVDRMSRHLAPEQKPCSYMRFLKGQGNV